MWYSRYNANFLNIVPHNSEMAPDNSAKTKYGENSEQNKATTAAYKVEFPPFAPENVRVWLKQVEICLQMGNIVSETNKFNHLASNLILNVAARVQDVLVDRPTENEFTKLK